MKKKMVYVATALIIGAVTVFNVKTVLDANRTYDLAMTSIDAFSENGENGEDGENGGGDGDQESNEHGSGSFFYQHRGSSPKSCTLYRHTHINGQNAYSETDQSLGEDWIITRIEGIAENCSNIGNGCTTQKCQLAY